MISIGCWHPQPSSYDNIQILCHTDTTTALVYEAADVADGMQWMESQAHQKVKFHNTYYFQGRPTTLFHFQKKPKKGTRGTFQDASVVREPRCLDLILWYIALQKGNPEISHPLEHIQRDVDLMKRMFGISRESGNATTGGSYGTVWFRMDRAIKIVPLSPEPLESQFFPKEISLAREMGNRGIGPSVHSAGIGEGCTLGWIEMERGTKMHSLDPSIHRQEIIRLCQMLAEKQLFLMDNKTSNTIMLDGGRGIRAIDFDTGFSFNVGETPLGCSEKHLMLANLFMYAIASIRGETRGLVASVLEEELDDDAIYTINMVLDYFDGWFMLEHYLNPGKRKNSKKRQFQKIQEVLPIIYVNTRAIQRHRQAEFLVGE